MIFCNFFIFSNFFEFFYFFVFFEKILVFLYNRLGGAHERLGGAHVERHVSPLIRAGSCLFSPSGLFVYLALRA